MDRSRPALPAAAACILYAACTDAQALLFPLW